MDVLEAITARRAVRDYTPAQVERGVLEKLLDAAIHAPSALNVQPWAFVVIQDAASLRRYADRAKQAFLAQAPSGPHSGHLRDLLSNPDFTVFYNAGTLIVIYAAPLGLNPAEDCCLAAQNLMLAACAKGLGTCPIGLARPLFNLPEVKKELGVPPEFTAVLPIIVGYPKDTPPPVTRNPVKVLAWK